ncbi:MAG: hypothetical protein WB610_06220 [Rhodomicrobium sp.]
MSSSTRTPAIRMSLGALCSVAAVTCFIAVATGAEVKAGVFDRGDNALWMRRHWMHENPAPVEIAALANSLRAHGIKRIYPFLGPMDREGWPGWRSKAGFVRYDPERAARFLAEMHRIAPEIRVMPWTGGILDRDVNLKDERQRKAFADHMRRLVEAGADGVHLNIEPLASGAPEYLELLRNVKAAIGSHTLSVAALPPPIPGQPGEDMHWELPFLREVCRNANEIAVMAYNTGLTSPRAFETSIAAWTKDLASALPSPQAGGCEWLMGVPAYDDDKDYHRPDVETIEHSLNGIVAGLRGVKNLQNFRGVAIYASFTADERKWAVFDRLWRGAEPALSPPPDPRNTME